MRPSGATAITATAISSTNSPTLPVVDGVRTSASETAVRIASSLPYTIASTITTTVIGTISARHGSNDSTCPSTTAETHIVK